MYSHPCGWPTDATDATDRAGPHRHTCLECLNPPWVGASRHPPALRSLYSLPGWPGVAVKNRSTAGAGKCGGQEKTARALASSLSQRRWPYPDGMILGNRYSLMDCLMCDKQGPHYLYSADRDDVFQCDQCFAMFTDDSPKWFE